jgi:hypothetical protein
MCQAVSTSVTTSSRHDRQQHHAIFYCTGNAYRTPPYPPYVEATDAVAMCPAVRVTRLIIHICCISTVLTSSIIDITIPIAPGLPVWESDAGLPPTHRELDLAIKRGDPINHSHIKLSVHTGTHVDAPSHFLDEALDDGRNMEWLSLDTLVGRALVVEIYGSNVTAEALQVGHGCVIDT